MGGGGGKQEVQHLQEAPLLSKAPWHLRIPIYQKVYNFFFFFFGGRPGSQTLKDTWDLEGTKEGSGGSYGRSALVADMVTEHSGVGECP